MTSDPEIVVIVIFLGCLYGTLIGVVCHAISNPMLPSLLRALLCVVLLVVGMLAIGKEVMINGIMEVTSLGK
jgi:NhaP-type Na+/H+ or K+/H+ antiporter